MTQTEIDILQLRDELNSLKQRVATLENQQVTFPTVTAASPCCYNYPMSLSAARQCWPGLEHEFDNYCMNNRLTSFGYQDSVDFFNKYVSVGADFP